MMNKIVFTWDTSENGNQIYHIQYIDNDIPRYLGRILADYLSTAIWFYKLEGISIEIVGKRASLSS